MGGPLAMENYRSREDPERVLAICRAAVEESPFSLDKRTLVGQILYELGRTEEARHELELVEHFMQQGSPAYRLLADMERVEGRLHQAARRYFQALALDNRNDMCWSHLREINAALADALQQVFEIMSEVQDNPEAGQTIQMEKEKPGPEQIMATLDGWLNNIQQIKSKKETGANS
jgi:tetratricopeptide (TPR) repeat protein